MWSAHTSSMGEEITAELQADGNLVVKTVVTNALVTYVHMGLTHAYVMRYENLTPTGIDMQSHYYLV